MKTLLLLLFSTLFLSIISQDCNNPLLKTFNFTGLAEPQAGTGLPFCQDLQSGQTCCSSETVRQFQSLINSLQQKLLNVSGQRDKNFASLRIDVLANYVSLVDELNDFDSNISTLQGMNSTIGDEVRNEFNLFIDISNRLGTIETDNDFFTALDEYQITRVACLNTLLRVQASAWCLACNPNYASQGVSENGSITFSADLNATIISTCLPFTTNGDNFNALFQANESLNRVQNLITYMQTYVNGGNVIPNLTISNDINEPTDPTQRTNSIPDNCNLTICPFQDENLFTNGVLNQSIASNGAGVIGGSDISLPDVGEILPPLNNGTKNTNNNNATTPTNTITGNNNNNSTRLLQNNSTWNPDLTQTGVQFTVIADPGQVSGLQGDGNDNNNNSGNNGGGPENIAGALSSVRVRVSGLTIITAIIAVLII